MSKLSPTDWATIVTLYERGEKNQRELAEMFGVTPQAIQKGLKERGVEKGSRVSEVMDEVDEAAREARKKRVEQATGAVEQYAKFNDVIAKLTIKRVMEGDRDGNLATKNAEILVLKNAGAIVQRARIENWDILDIKDLLGDEAELPDLNIGEYTPEELEKIRQANEESYNEGIDDPEIMVGDDADEDDEI